MFKKLTQNFINSDIKDWSIFNSSIQTSGFVGNGTDTYLSYCLLTNIGEFMSVHTREFCKIPPSIALYSQLTGQGLHGAHIDHGPKCALNYYISAGIDETIFYKKKTNDVKSMLYPGKTQANGYDVKDLDEVDKFVANSNEAYLLNVSEIHSVNKITNNTRTFIAYLWYNHTYEEVLENLC